MVGGRTDSREYAERVNAAADLVAAGVPVAEAARELAGRFGCSPRQARRYVERAVEAGHLDAPLETIVFTVKLASQLAARVRAHARATGVTISAVVAAALEEFLAGAAESVAVGERAGGRDAVRLRSPRCRGFVGGVRHSRARTAGPRGAVRPG